MHGIRIAKDDYLASILNGRKATAVEFMVKALTAYHSIHIADFAKYDTLV